MVNAMMRSGITVADDGTMAFGYTIGTGQVTLANDGQSLNDGMFVNPTTAPAISITTPTSLPRVDMIVTRRNYANHCVTFECITGTEASAPVPPSLVRDSSYYDNALYAFKVDTSGTITLYRDYRSDPNYCGAIRARNTSELDEYIKTVQTNITRLTELQAASGGREITISTDAPSSPSAGAIWFKSDTNGRLAIKVYQADGTWRDYSMSVASSDVEVGDTTADKTLVDKVIGVKPGGDGAPQHGETQDPLSLTTAKTGFYSTTDYATLSSSKIKILKAGIYHVTATVYLSAGAQKLFKATINLNGVTQAENTNSGSSESAAISAATTIHCSVGDKISIKLSCSGSTAYRYSAAYTHLEVVPVVFD